jgi:hypothetical protein
MSKGVIKFSQFDIKNLVFTKLEDNPRVKSQKIGYVRYKSGSEENQFKMQTPEIISEQYGIPREGPYYPDAKSRSFYKFAFCQDRHKYDDPSKETYVDYEAIGLFYDHLKSIDAMCDTDEFRKTIFGDKAYNQYAYQQLVRTPEEDPDEPILTKDGQPAYRPPFTKIKLELEYSAPEEENPSTKPTFNLLERTEKMEGDKKVATRTKIEMTCFEDMVEHIKYMSKLRFIISFNKIYAMKTKSGSEKKKYGITLKATHVEVKHSSFGQKVKEEEDAFSDSETDQVINTAAPTIKRSMAALDVEDDVSEEVVEDDSSEEVVSHTLDKDVDDDDEEEVIEEVVEEVVEPVKQTKKPTPAKRGTKTITKH